MKKKLTKPSAFRQFDWEKAKGFYYVAQMEGFTSAGEFLYISQSALSRQIKDLEQTLGVQLFIRGARGVVLTRKGEELFEIIGETFNRLGDFTAKNKILPPKGTPRTICIGIERWFEYLVIGGLHSYQRAHPYLTFDLIQYVPNKDSHIIDLDAAICRDSFGKKQGLSFEITPELENTISSSVRMVISGNLSPSPANLPVHFIISSALKDDEELIDLAKHLQGKAEL